MKYTSCNGVMRCEGNYVLCVGKDREEGSRDLFQDRNDRRWLCRDSNRYMPNTKPFSVAN